MCELGTNMHLFLCKCEFMCGGLCDKGNALVHSMNVGKPNRVCHFGSTGCQLWGAAVIKIMTFLFASMPLTEPMLCPVDLCWRWEGTQTAGGKNSPKP